MRIPKFALAITAASLACGDNAATSGDGVTRTLLTDVPFPYDRVARVDLYVVSISASLAPDTTSAGQFVTLATPNRRINVLALQGGVTEELGAVTLPSGAISAVRMIIDTDSSSITLRNGSVLTGRTTPGIQWQSSAGRPVLNATLNERIGVPREGATVVIDFDVGKAFIPPQEINPASTDSGFIFSPVIRAVDAARSGSIVGTVKARTATGIAVPNASLRLYVGRPGTPENTWPMLATARADANGAFKFAYVTPLSYWTSLPAYAGATYIVAADPPSGAGLGRAVVPGLTVAAGAETAAGAIVLP
ncbi:MAG TPA: DUF4382 domain-containing protein [Gemmatimonadaceae bacterium]|nr:DUF4382 domain-containing protein [Gemmatimonadaceae bacterium]